MALARGLPHQTFVAQKLLRQALAWQGIAAEQRKAAVAVRHIPGTHLGPEVGSQVFECQLAHIFQPVVALDALAQAGKPCGHPGLLALGSVFARRDGG